MKTKKLSSCISLCLILFICCVLFFACDNKNTLTLYFDSKGGTTYEPMKYHAGETFIMPDDPIKEGYLFDGWCQSKASIETPFNETIVYNLPLNKDLEITIYAKWIKKVNITFESNGGSQCEVLNFDSFDDRLPTPTKQEYVFEGWYLDEELTIPYTLETPVEQNDITVYAKWSYIINENLFTVYYSPWEEFGDSSEVFDKTREIKLLQPSILGKDFQGWYFDSECLDPVPELFPVERVKDRYINLYAKIVEKEVEKLSIVGEPKLEYKYGEDFDANGAKLLIEYADSKYEDELIEITEDLITNFKTKDENNDPRPEIWRSHFSYPDYETYHSNFYICLNNISIGTEYVVISDIQSFSIDETKLVFKQGDIVSLEEKGIVVNYTDLQGDIGSEALSDWLIQQSVEPYDYFVATLNNYDHTLSTENVGVFTAELRYHFKKITVTYMVLVNE